jgi:hypothetical protein
MQFKLGGHWALQAPQWLRSMLKLRHSPAQNASPGAQGDGGSQGGSFTRPQWVQPPTVGVKFTLQVYTQRPA